MGLEYFIWGVWIVQGAAVVLLAYYAAIDDRWFAACGAIVGAIIGYSPFWFVQGPTVWKPAIFILVVSTIVLIMMFAFAARWVAFVAALLLLVAPLSYRLFMFESVRPSTGVLFGVLAFFGETAFLSGPIVCALACREIGDWLDRCRPMRRSV